MNDLIRFYQERHQQHTAKARTLGAAYNRLAVGRLAAFLAGVFLGVFLWSWSPVLTGLWGVVFLAGFFYLVRRHNQIAERRAHQTLLAQVNQEEEAAVGYRFQVFEDGAEFRDPLHPYSGDLDLFGPYSVFQFINRTTTPQGKETLAAYLLHPATPPVIAARQEAVRELGRLPDWRHAFRALGMANPSSLRHQEQLQRWLEQAPVFRFRKAMFWTLILLPVLAATAFAVTLFRGESWWVSATCLLPAALLTGRYAKRVQGIHEATARTGAMLQAYAALLRHIETQRFEAPLLQTLQTAIHTPRISASRALKQLGYLIHQLDVRYNPFAILLNLFGLWDLQWVYRLENWKTEWKPVLAGWFHTLAQFEALSSLGNLHFNHPGWAFPLVETGLDFQSKGLAHPLIPPGRRVGNDLGMPVRAHLKLITGSNMAGKSTFLRSAGVNIVLAQSGAPVCAQAMELPPLQVFTSMRTQDALSENASSFYAELRRLKTLIETAQASQDGPMPVFFLLDEILKGTNSRDRHQGAAALIRQLIRLQSAGLIATHDLELASLEAESQGHIENRYIDVQLQDGRLVFDYQLKKGVSQSFNATQLMAEMGIEV